MFAEKNIPTVYRAHLDALEQELRLARLRGDKRWIELRLHDLASYLEDPYLPVKLRPRVQILIDRWKAFYLILF